MLTMVLTGDDRMLDVFVKHLQAQSFMEVLEMSKEEQGTKLIFTTNLLPPLPKVSQVVLTTIDGKTIEIELLDVVETKVDEHIRKVVGNSYDIFATPVQGG